ncbi:MAG: FAD-binding protein [Firmicutes bacterium]|nr:FAD-binding protein [Bacillota bacterium]
MITIKEYVMPKNIDKAYEYLISKKNSMIFGGGAFIRMGSKNIALGIDLSKANLRYINEQDNKIEIGAMATFGDIERSEILKRFSGGILSIAIKDIVGIQLRNIVTLGGTVYSRYGFSDLITALLALDAKVKLYKGGVRTLEEFLENGSKSKDILEKVIISKTDGFSVFKSMRNSKGDYAILNLAISKVDGKYRIAIGARPQRAIISSQAMDFLNKNQINDKAIEKASNILASETVFGSNSRGSSKYRHEISKVLFKRAIEEVMANEN